MKRFGVFLCIIGVLIVAGATLGYLSSEHEGLCIAGMVLGAGLFGTGSIMFVTNAVVELARRGANLMIRGEFLGVSLMIKGEMERTEDETRRHEDRTGESRVSRVD